MFNRRAVFRQVMGAGANGEFFIAMETVEDPDAEAGEDYGLTSIQRSQITTIKGRALLIFEPDRIYRDRCNFTFLMDYNLDSNRASNVVFTDSELALFMIGEFVMLRSMFRREKISDLEDINFYANQMREASKIKTNRKEDRIIKTVTKSFQRALQSIGGFRELPHLGDPHVNMEVCNVEGEKNFVGRASCVIDADVFQCAAWEIHKNREAALLRSIDKRHKKRQLCDDGPHSFLYYLQYRLGAGWIHNRDFFMHGAWKGEGTTSEGETSTIVLCYADNENVENRGLGGTGKIDVTGSEECVRGFTWTLWRFEALERVGGRAQTKVTRVTQANLKGYLPSRLVNREIRRNLLLQNRLRLQYDKSEDLDRDSRERTKEMMKNVNAQSYSKEDAALVKSILDQFKVFHNNKTKDKMKDARIRGIGCKGTIYHKKGGSGVMGHNEYTHFWLSLFGKSEDSKYQTVVWGESTSVVRCGIEDLLAYIWNADDRSGKDLNATEKRVVKHKSACHQILYTREMLGGVLSPRDFLTSRIWKKLSHDEYIVVSHPCTDKEILTEVKTLHGVVRAERHGILKLKRIDDNKTKLDMLVSPHLRGRIPLFYVNSIMSGYLGYAREATRYFLELRGMEDYDEMDGNHIAEELVIAHDTGGQRAVEIELGKFKGLREMEERNPNFGVLIGRVCKNSLRRPQDESARLCNMLEGDAERIGGSLSMR